LENNVKGFWNFFRIFFNILLPANSLVRLISGLSKFSGYFFGDRMYLCRLYFDLLPASDRQYLKNQVLKELPGFWATEECAPDRARSRRQLRADG